MFYKIHPNLKKNESLNSETNKAMAPEFERSDINPTQDLARERARKLIKERRASLLLRSVFLIFI